ncbi:MAG: hypothetical protein WD491_04205 [Balneolales bacterium]
MANEQSFKDFLLDKKDKLEENKIDWEKRKIDWLAAIDTLYFQVKNWLKPFEDEGLIKIEDDKVITLYEDFIGSYDTKRLDIYFGSESIKLVPKGTLIIGSYGRVDMKAPNGEIMLMRDEANQWKFVRRFTRSLESWDVTEKSFKAMMQKLS